MIFIGVDNIIISRFDPSLLANRSFLNHCFTPSEQTYCHSKPDPAPHFAVRFAAKEAVIKAISGINLYLDLNKIEITNDAQGRPYLTFITDDPMFKELRSDISLSHSDTSAIAFVVIYNLKSRTF